MTTLYRYKAVNPLTGPGLLRPFLGGPDQPINNRSSLVAGTYKPTATTTGVLPGSTLTPAVGDQVITTDGTTLSNLDIFGAVKVQAANVTVQNCRVRGGVAAVSQGIVDFTSPLAVNGLVVDCTIVADNPSVYWTGIIGAGFTALRNDVSQVVDGFGGYNTNNSDGPVAVDIEANYIHDLTYFTPDPGHTDNQTHNDGFQIQGNSGYRFVGNNVIATASTTAGNPVGNDPAYPSANGQCLSITPTVGAVSGVLIDRNWMDYGNQCITIPASGLAVSGVTITNNRFGRHQPFITKTNDPVSRQRVILVDPAVTVNNFPTTSGPDLTCGNVYDDDGSAVTIYRFADGIVSYP